VQLILAKQKTHERAAVSKRRLLVKFKGEGRIIHYFFYIAIVRLK